MLTAGCLTNLFAMGPLSLARTHSHRRLPGSMGTTMGIGQLWLCSDAFSSLSGRKHPACEFGSCKDVDDSTSGRESTETGNTCFTGLSHPQKVEGTMAESGTH
mmetsp:Transcript_78206/g.203863  ORF Transcript_78206/g.203863 Transcript_78206/m.203863 type:complete len:103 (-) Transcript_78206:348-656(-)